MKKTLLSILLLLVFFLPVSAQENESAVPDFSTTARAEVPEEYTWNIADLFVDADAWIAEKNRLAGRIEEIDAMAADWTDSAANMLAFFKLQDDFGINGAKVYQWAMFQYHMDMENPKYQMMLGQLQFLFSQYSAKTSFIQSDILALGPEKFDEYVNAEPALEDYAFGVRNIFRQKEHILPADQQKIVSLTGMFGGVASQASSMLNNVSIPNPKVTLSDGKEYTLNYSTFALLRSRPNPADREKVMDAFFNNIKQYDATFAVLLDGEMKKHMFSAQVHNYENALEARMSGEKIDTAVYHTNIKMVKANLDSLHRYMTLKKKLLGLEEYKYSDIYASAVKAVEKEFPWDEARELIMAALVPLGDEYQSGLQRAFAERWIDRYPNKGKQSGAYSSGVYAAHPYIKMNYTGNFSNVSTLAHELGHAMHSYFSSKHQPFAKASYSTFLAEMASTFNEHMLIDYLIENEDDDMLKLFILDNYLEGIRGTVFRQTLFAEFELAMHEYVEKGNTLTADWLNKKYLELTREYYGHDKDVVKVDEFIQCEWAVIPHFFMNYYVSNYSTGMISSMALAKMVKEEGNEGAERYLASFLSAGGSDFSLDILKRTGVDMTTEEPFKAAFERYNAILAEMEAIVARLEADGKLAE